MKKHNSFDTVILHTVADMAVISMLKAARNINDRMYMQMLILNDLYTLLIEDYEKEITRKGN